MKFEYQHTFDASVDQVVAAMFHPDMTAFLKSRMKTLVNIEVLERQDEPGKIKRRVKYVPVPSIKRIGPKKITPESMQWIEQSTFDTAGKVMTFENVPTHPKVRAQMTNSGKIEFRSLGPGRTERIMSGDLKIAFPILGRIAEGIIEKNAKAIITEEAGLLAEWLKTHP
jgi:hypothetical protein